LTVYISLLDLNKGRNQAVPFGNRRNNQMEQSVNERFLKLSSRLPFYKDIELGQDLTLNIEGQTFIVNCVKQEVFDKQDGSVDKVFVLKSVIE
jgi:hypothetical protein